MKQQLRGFASSGLRTLVLGARVLPREEAVAWLQVGCDRAPVFTAVGGVSGVTSRGRRYLA